MTDKPQPKKPRGRPRNQALDALQKELAISRRQAQRLLREQKTDMSGKDIPTPLATARLTKTLREIELLESKVRAAKLRERELSGELLFLSEALVLVGSASTAIKNALAILPKNLGPRLHGQSQKAIEVTLANECDRICALAESAVAGVKGKARL
jgi:hypothetical protein